MISKLASQNKVSMQTVNSLVDDLKLLPHPEADTTTTLMYVTIDTAKVYSQGGQGPLI